MKIKYCFLFAMEEEAKKIIEISNKITSKPFKIYEYKSNLVVICNIGLVNASSCIGYLSEKYDIEKFINMGFSGTDNNQLKINDSVIVKNAIYLTADATVFGYEYGQIPKCKEYFSTDENLNNFLKKKLNINKFQNIGSSDIFINKLTILNSFKEKINLDVSLYDMEATALIHSCNLFDKPISCIKVISDNVNFESNEIAFNDTLKNSAILFKEIILKLTKGEKYVS